MFVLRAARISDIEGLFDVAQFLDSVNLPHDRERLAEAIARSEKSFSGVCKPSDREFLLVATDLDDATKSESIAGCAMIFAQHGSRKSPHVFFDVIEEERYSETLDRHFRHQILRIGYNYAGLTEIGGLVVRPEFRRHTERIGRQLVAARFMYIALRRSLFRDQVLSELMPPLAPDGTSLLWEALGRRFTGLSYQEADRLSRVNKEFIRALFPQDPLYASLLDEGARAVIGKVGPNTKGVEKLLIEAGFQYSQRIDPFDGGPHFLAQTDEISAVRATREVSVGALEAEGANLPDELMVAALLPEAPWFRAVRTQGRWLSTPGSAAPSSIALTAAACATLGIDLGAKVAVLPQPQRPSASP